MKPLINIKVKERGDGLKKVAASLRRLTRAKVYVGIPAKNSGRSGNSTVTNPQLAFLLTHGVRSSSMRRIMGASQINRGIDHKQALALYLHTYGSPAWQIPPRPILEPAIEAPDNRSRIEAQLQLAAKAAMNGDPDATVMRYLNLAGMMAQNSARAWFTDPRNGWPPNAPSTIKRKGSSRPNIDKGEMRKAITYVVSKDGRV